MALLMLVFSVSPILAPLAGSAVIALVGWRGVFGAVAAAALLGLLAMYRMVDETHGPERRTGHSVAGTLSAYGRLLRDAHYLGLVFIGGAAMAGFFVYLSGSPFVLIGHYGLSPTQYSVLFACNAVAFIGSAQGTGWLGRRFGLPRLVRWAATAAAMVTVALLGYYLLGGDRLVVLVVMYFVASACMGLVVPTSSVLALEAHGAIAGTASALMGTLQMLGGAIVMGVAGLFADGRPLPMVAGMAAGALAGMMLAWITLGGEQRPGRIERVVG
jgi:DHA1 family bicyclomycin/chloramphenicol resistance-like MFS transporter